MLCSQVHWNSFLNRHTKGDHVVATFVCLFKNEFQCTCEQSIELNLVNPRGLHQICDLCLNSVLLSVELNSEARPDTRQILGPTFPNVSPFVRKAHVEFESFSYVNVAHTGGTLEVLRA